MILYMYRLAWLCKYFQACNDMFNIKKIVNTFPLLELAQSMDYFVWLCFIKQLDCASVSHTWLALDILFYIKKIVKIFPLQELAQSMVYYVWLCYIKQFHCASVSHTAYFVKYQDIRGNILTSRSSTIDGYLCMMILYKAAWLCKYLSGL